MTRHLAIGDIHGCFNALTTLTEFVGFRADDTIITLGDYVDRGPDTCAVLDWLIHYDKTHTLIPLRGNHEIMMLEAREQDDCFRDWMACGGEETLRSYSPFDGVAGKLVDVSDGHWQFLRHRLVDSYETATHFFVHANAHADIPIEDQPAFLLYWQPFGDPDRHESGKIMVCGHTSQKSGLPLANGNAICIDTWAYGGGWLTCLHVESGTFWQANENGETRTFEMDEIASLNAM